MGISLPYTLRIGGKPAFMCTSDASSLTARFSMALRSIHLSVSSYSAKGKPLVQSRSYQLLGTS